LRNLDNLAIKPFLNEIFDDIELLFVTSNFIDIPEKRFYSFGRLYNAVVKFELITNNFLSFSLLVSQGGVEIFRLNFSLQHTYFNRKMECHEKIYDFLESNNLKISSAKFLFVKVIAKEKKNEKNYVVYYVPTI
jgi:hypothetical protein